MSSTTGLGSSVAPSFDSETLEHCSNDDDVDINQKVPKSASSSSGVNEISDSSNNSTDEYNKRMEEVTEKEKAGYIPTFRDVMDLLKFSYILQVSIYLFSQNTGTLHCRYIGTEPFFQETVVTILVESHSCQPII